MASQAQHKLVGYQVVNGDDLKNLVEAGVLVKTEANVVSYAVNIALYTEKDTVQDFMQIIEWQIDDNMNRHLWPTWVCHEDSVESLSIYELQLLGHDTGLYVSFDENEQVYRFFTKSNSYYRSLLISGNN